MKRGKAKGPDYERLAVGQVRTISDGNGGALQAKIDKVERYAVFYRTRTGTRGPFRKEGKTSPAAFYRLEREAA